MSESFDVCVDTNMRWNSHNMRFLPTQVDSCFTEKETRRHSNAARAAPLHGGFCLPDNKAAWHDQLRAVHVDTGAVVAGRHVCCEEGSPSSGRDRPRLSWSWECQCCTVLALAVLLFLHLLNAYQIADIVVSVYLLVLAPLVGSFCSVGNVMQVHAYAVNLSAIVVVVLSVRFQRSFSFIFFLVLSGVLLHCLLALLTCKRKEASDARILVILIAAIFCNVLFTYLLLQHTMVVEYDPQHHALQALLICGNIGVYTYAGPRSFAL